MTIMPLLFPCIIFIMNGTFQYTTILFWYSQFIISLFINNRSNQFYRIYCISQCPPLHHYCHQPFRMDNRVILGNLEIIMDLDERWRNVRSFVLLYSSFKPGIDWKLDSHLPFLAVPDCHPTCFHLLCRYLVSELEKGEWWRLWALGITWHVP